MTSEELKKANDLYAQEAKMTSTSLLESMRANVQSVKNWAANISALAAKGINKDILKQLQDMGPESAEYVEAFMNMTASELGEVNSLYAETLSLDDKVADQLIASYAYAGSDSAMGFSKGLEKQSPDAVAKAEQMAVAALEAAKKVLGIHSPSTKFAEVAKYAVQGLVEGFKQYGSLANMATENIGKNSLNSLSQAISGVSNILDDADLNEPVIRPVLDLSNVKAGAKTIDAAFSKAQAISINASLHKSAGGSGTSDTAGGSKNVNYQFTQNNYSPKALSRVEIYRQTKNQFSSMKGLILK
jgi:hypothetical protein